MDPNTAKHQGVLYHNKHNYKIMSMVDTVLDAVEEVSIDENLCFLENKSTCNDFVYAKYLSKIIDAPDVYYICVHCNAVLT